MMALRRWGALALSVIPAVHLAAQVGHDPAHSPYRDIPRGGAAVASVGYLGGGRGDVGVGKADGATAGVRYEAALGRVIGVSFGFAYALTTRFVVDPAKDSLSRKSGPVDDGTILVDAGLQLNLTGQKSWHGLAPYLGGALGMAFSPARVAADTSGYTFGTKITLAPNAGLRWYAGRRLSVRADARLVLWRLSYPIAFRVPNQFDGSSVLPPGAPLGQWTAHPWVTIGLGWIF
jgi:hypothetical protein